MNTETNEAVETKDTVTQLMRSLRSAVNTYNNIDVSNADAHEKIAALKKEMKQMALEEIEQTEERDLIKVNMEKTKLEKSLDKVDEKKDKYRKLIAAKHDALLEALDELLPDDL